MFGRDFIFLDPCPKWTCVCWPTFTAVYFQHTESVVQFNNASSAENLWHLDFEFFGLHQLSQLFFSLLSWIALRKTSIWYDILGKFNTK
jgi:hypothetical protein